MRYDGEWYRGRPHGIGRWSFVRKGDGKRLKELVKPTAFVYGQEATAGALSASGYDVYVHPDGLPESMQESQGAQGMLTRRRKVDLEAIARVARVWWPVVSKSMADAVSSEAAHKFFKRVLKTDSQVRVLAAIDLPHGWGRVKKPTLQKELWIHDPERQQLRRGEDECIAVVRVFFSSDFAPNPAPTMPRGKDDEVVDAHVSFTIGVTKRLSMWDKCTALNEQADVGALAVPIPQPPLGQSRRSRWAWREEACCGYEAGCVEKPKCSLEHELDADAPLCVSCASSSALKRLLEMGEQCRRAVRGVALPLSALEYEDLARLRRSALVWLQHTAAIMPLLKHTAARCRRCNTQSQSCRCCTALLTHRPLPASCRSSAGTPPDPTRTPTHSPSARPASRSGGRPKSKSTPLSLTWSTQSSTFARACRG